MTASALKTCSCTCTKANVHCVVNISISLFDPCNLGIFETIFCLCTPYRSQVSKAGEEVVEEEGDFSKFIFWLL